MSKLASTNGAQAQCRASSNQEPLVCAQGVTVAFDGRNVLDNVDLSLTSGEIVTLIGPNGSGKSTLVRVLLSLIKPDSGSVWRRPDLRIGYTPQQLPLDPIMPITVGRFLNLSARQPKDRILSVLRETGADHLVDRQLSGLSGGEVHRTLLARALLGTPDLLVLDEPMAGVDIAGQATLYTLVQRIREHHGCGVLLVSHDLHMVIAAADRVVCLNHHVCCTGHPDHVIVDPAFQSLFGSELPRAIAPYHHQHDHVHDESGAVVQPRRVLQSHLDD